MSLCLAVLVVSACRRRPAHEGNGCVENQARQWFALFSGSPALIPAVWLLLALAVCYVFVCLLCLLFHLFSWLSGPSCLGLERPRNSSDGPLPCSLASLLGPWQSEGKGNGEFRSHSHRGNAEMLCSSSRKE